MMTSNTGTTPTATTPSTVVSFLDLFAFTGYKYLALTCNMIIGYGISILISKVDFSGGDNENDMGMGAGDNSGSDGSLMEDGSGMDNANMANGAGTGAEGYGQKGYYIMFFWTASSFAYFMLKTMANNIEKNAASSYYDQYQQQPHNGPKREFVILGFAMSQFVTLWFLGQTKFLN